MVVAAKLRKSASQRSDVALSIGDSPDLNGWHGKAHVVNESERITIVVASEQGSEVSLWLEDVPIEASGKVTLGGNWEISFDLFSQSSNYCTSYFQNFLGISSIAISVDDVFHYTALEVRSKKINAEQYLAMLDSVEMRFPGSVLSDSGVTEVNAEVAGQGARFKRGLIPFCSRLLDELTISTDAVISRPRCKMSKRYSKAVESDASAFLDNKCLDWILSNPDCLSPASRGSASKLFWGQKRLEVTNNLVANYHDDPDTYENRVLLGLVDSVLKFSLGLRRHFETAIKLKQGDASYLNENEISMQSIMVFHAEKLYAPLISQLKDISNNASALASKIRATLGVSRSISEVPILTPSFRNVTSYQRIFQLAQDWYGKTRVDQRRAETASPVQSVAKIFELYSLVKIMDAIEAIGFVKDQDVDKMQNQDQNTYSYVRADGVRCNLQYDIAIPSPNNWKHGQPDIVDTKFSGNLRPDFLVTFQNTVGDEIYLILDAKFTSYKLAKEKYLGDLCRKYLDRFTTTSGGLSKIVGLTICQPAMFANDETEQNFDYALDQFASDGASPKIPFQSVRSINLKATASIERLFRKYSNNQTISDLFIVRSSIDAPPNYDNHLSGMKTKRALGRTNQMNEQDARVIRGMIARGDHSQDIAAWFGLNLGRVAEVKNLQRFPDAEPAEMSDLPPSGPYPSIKTLFNAGAIKVGDYGEMDSD